MKKIIILFILSLTFLNVNAGVRYVTLAGNNGNSGLTEALAWRTLTYAVGGSSNIVAGDTVYVKGGDYGNENIVFSKQGSAGLPIKIIGYTSVVGDTPPLLINNTNPYAAYTSTAMPTYVGTNRNTGICFDLRNKKYISISNIQLRTYSYGVITGGTTKTDYGFNNFYNVNMMTLGDLTAYDGRAFMIGTLDTSRSSFNTFKNCLVVNAHAEGFTICGNNNILERCKTYTDENANQTQYHFTIVGDDNLISYCLAEKKKGTSFLGTHGFSLKSNAEKIVDQGFSYPPYNPQRNKFLYCSVNYIPEGFVFRHRGVQNNLVYGCNAKGDDNGSNNADGNGCVFRDGASWNVVEKLTVDSCYSAIEFEDTTEDGDSGGSPTGHPGNFNKIINSTFSTCEFVVKFGIDGGVNSDAGDNSIEFCSFYNCSYFFYCARRCTTMRYVGNIFYGNNTFGYFRGSTYATDVTQSQFTDCTFYNINAGLPGGFSSTGQLTTNPNYTNAATRNFILQVGSPCINSANTAAVAETSSIPINQFENPATNNLMLFGTKYYKRPSPNVTRNALGQIYYGTRNRGAY
jgi:hypothetical protein